VIVSPLFEPTVQLTAVSGVPLNSTWAVELTVNPEPETESALPIGPCPGSAARVGTVTVNVSELDVVIVVRSVATTAKGPGTDVGTANAQVKFPPEEVVTSEPLTEPTVQPIGETVAELNVTFADALAVNPVAVTWKVAPTGPIEGAIVIASVVTWKLPVANWPPTSVARTVVPEVPLGTAMEQENIPVAVVVREPRIGQELIISPSNDSDASGVDTENPVPEMVTGDPTGP
jgi:hypothetical protein